MHPKAQAALRVITSTFHEDLTLSRMAKDLQLSKSRFSHLLSTEVGMSPMKMVRMLRLQKAAVLLRETLLSIKEIAATIGYKQSCHFMRDFKKVYGTTPSQYRLSNSNVAHMQDEPSIQ